jgi:hypothetical protein
MTIMASSIWQIKTNYKQMKTKHLFICGFILTILHLNGFSQNLISESKLWSVVTKGVWEQTWVRTTSFKFLGDSTIKGVVYHKLLWTENENLRQWKLGSLWREGADKRIYSPPVYSSQTKESVVYDFNLSEKDTFPLRVINGEMVTYLVVDSIRVKDWGNTVKRIWYLHSPQYYYNSKTMWVEGVGSMGNLTNSTEAEVMGGSSSLLCFSENGEKVYQNPKYSGCYINLTSVPTLPSQKQLIELVPLGEGVLQLSGEKTGELFLYTLDGKQVLNKELSLSTTTICAPTGGILLYRFIGKDGEVQTGKVMVK